MQTIGAQNALWQSQLGNSTAAGISSLTSMSSNSSSPNLNGFGPADLQALQMALQQQQQNLQQQLQNFILFQQPTNVQASAMLLQSQISQAVAQATNQLRVLQRHNNVNQSSTSPLAASSMQLDSTPKRIMDHEKGLRYRV